MKHFAHWFVGPLEHKATAQTPFYSFIPPVLGRHAHRASNATQP